MAKSNTIWWLIGGALLAGTGFVIYKKGTAFNAITSKVQDAKITIANGAANIEIKLLVSNPSDDNLTLKSLTGNININTSQVGVVNLKSNLLIPAKSDVLTTLTASIPFTNLLKASNDLVSMGKPIVAYFKGIADVGIQLPVNYSFPFTATSLKNIFKL